MGIVFTPESAHAIEMRKWEAYPTQYGPPGRPFTHQEYPGRMYKAARLPDGTRAIVEALDANNDLERRNLESRGFVWGGQGAAIDALDAHEAQAATLAAERHFEVRRMSDGAQREVASAEEAAGARHLPTIEETPVRRRQPKGDA